MAVASTVITVAIVSVSGTWTGTLSPDGGEPRPAHLVLQQDGEMVTGTAGATDQSERLPIRKGVAKNGVVTFEVEASDGLVMQFVLKEQGDELRGVVTREREGEQQRATLLVTRVK